MEEKKVVQNNDNTVEIDLGVLFRELWSKMPVLILLTLIGAVLAFAISSFVITPQYVSTTKLYVMTGQQGDQDSINTNELQAGQLLTKDYEQIIESRDVTERVIADLSLAIDGKTMTHEQLLDKMTVDTPADTRIVSISVRDPNPQIAQSIAAEVSDVAVDQIKDIINADTVKVVEKANLPEEPDTPKIPRNTAVGAIIGLLVAVIAVSIGVIRNKAINTTEDVEKYLGLSNLGTIPKSKEIGKTGKRIEKQERSEKRKKGKGAKK